PGTGTGGTSGTGGAPVGTGGAGGSVGGGTGGAAGGQQVPLATPDPAAVQNCTNQIKVECAKLEACLPGALKATYGDRPTCETQGAVVCKYEPAIPGTLVTPAMRTACVQARM